MLLQPNATTRKLVSERVYEGTGGNNLLTTATLTSTDKANHALVIGGICVTQASIPTGMFCEGVTLWTLTRMVVPFRSYGPEGSNGMSPQRDRAVGQITERTFNATMSETEKEGERRFPFRLVRRTTSVYVAESVARTVTLRRSCLVGRTAGKLELFFEF